MNLTFFNEFWAKSPVTFLISLVVFILTLTGTWNRKLFFDLILHPYSIVRHRQYYRILTADLVNVDLLHLMLNEFMLYVFCSDLEETLYQKSHSGAFYFLTIYFGSLLIASAAVIIRHFRDFNYSSTGTSGSIMGCMFAFMVIAPNHMIYHVPGLGGIKNLYGGLAYILMIIVYQQRKKDGNINQEFHFYGALTGAILGFILRMVL